MMRWVRKRFWFSTWRAKLYVGGGLLVLMVVGGIVFTYRRFGDWSLLWAALMPVLGWFAGKSIGEASNQRSAEQAASQRQRNDHAQ